MYFFKRILLTWTRYQAHRLPAAPGLRHVQRENKRCLVFSSSIYSCLVFSSWYKWRSYKWKQRIYKSTSWWYWKKRTWRNGNVAYCTHIKYSSGSAWLANVCILKGFSLWILISIYCTIKAVDWGNKAYKLRLASPTKNECLQMGRWTGIC